MMETEEEVKDFLAHHGVLGMHWGQRKQRVSAGGGNKPTRRVQIRDARIGQLRKDPFAQQEYKSKATVALGRAATISALGTIGAGVFRLYGPNNPKVQLGAKITQLTLGAASVGFSIANAHASNTDLIKKYGK